MRMSVRIRTFVSERADPQTWVWGPILPGRRGRCFGAATAADHRGYGGTGIDCPR